MSGVVRDIVSVAMKRISVKTKIPDYLISSMERLAKLKNWDIDLVHEEALIHYLNSEHIRVPYTERMKKTIPTTVIVKTVAPKARKAAAVAQKNVVRNVTKAKNRAVAAHKELKSAVASNRKTNGGKLKPFSLKGTY